jgi:hypothetical protein
MFWFFFKAVLVGFVTVVDAVFLSSAIDIDVSLFCG